jgi:hypothetical protein
MILCKLFGHRLRGRELKDVDPLHYPYCGRCGWNPAENFNFEWFNNKHLDVRNRLLGYGKYHKSIPKRCDYPSKEL